MDGVFAAGDCCRVRGEGQVRGVRHEAWQSALDQGNRAAYGLLGMTPPPLDAPWMWSDQYDYQLQVAGNPMLMDSLIVRGDVQRARFICFQLHRGRLVGAVSVNRSSELAVVRRVLPAAPRVDATSLADEQWSLRRLLRTSIPEPAS